MLVCLWLGHPQTACADISGDSGLKSHEVLLLHSYHSGVSWTDDITRGIQSVLNDRQDVNMCIEYMDAKRISGDAFISQLARVYQQKYQPDQLHLIIASDDNALNFILEYGPPIFGSVPVVFCGVTGYNESLRLRYPQLTGIVENHEILKTMNLALKVHPQSQSMHIILDSSESSMIRYQQYQQAVRQLDRPVEVEYLYNLTMEELKSRLSNLPSNSVVIQHLFVKDRNSQVFSASQIEEQITSACHQPIYGTFKNHLSKTTVGGYITDGVLHGQLAAKTALKILEGTPAGTIPVIENCPNPPMFDYTQLRRYHVSKTKLPPNSIILNKPHSVWEENRSILIPLGTVITCQFALLTFLIVMIFQKRAARKHLAYANIMLKNILDTIPVRVFWKDAELRFIGCNQLFAEDAGKYSPDEVIGKDDFDMVWRNQAEDYRADDYKVMDSQQPKIGFEEMQETPSGQTVWLRTSKIPLRDPQSGKLIGVLGTYEDITQSKEHEKELQRHNMKLQSFQEQLIAQHQTLVSINEELQSAIEKAREANSIKDEFLANMSHELRTPLNAVIGFSDLLTTEDLTDTQMEYVQMIDKAARHLLELLNDIFEFARIESGAMQVSLSECHIEKLVENIDKMFKPSAQAKSLEFQTGIDKQIPSVIMTDESLLQQCLINIITNAIKFTHEGSVQLDVRLCEDQAVLFCVRDTGIGIPADQQKRIFESFTQVDGSSTREYGGTGLGLTITKQLIEMLGGTITLESEPGRGTQFNLTIPAKATIPC